MKRKVAVTDEWSLKIDTGCLPESDFEVVYVPFKTNSSDEELVDDFKGFDYIINGKNIWTADVFKQLRGKLRMLVKPGTGVDPVNIKAAAENGVAVSNTPGANSRAVAEFALSLMLSIAARIPECHGKMKTGIWEDPPHRFTMMDKTVGLVGFGNIAQRVAGLLTGFPVDIVAFDVFHDDKKAESLGVKYVSLEELAEISDFVSVHVPLILATRGIVGREFISRMKDTAYIINTSRGGTVDTASVIEAVKQDKIAGFAADVFETEPLESGSELRILKNVIITPHMAGATDDSIISFLQRSLENVKAFDDGCPQNILDQSYLNYL